MNGRAGAAARRRMAASLIAAVLLLTGCTAASTTNPAVVTPTPEPSAVVSENTLQTLIDTPPESPRFEPLEESDEAELVSYQSGGFTINAVIRRPDDAPMRAPGIVFVHGAVDPVAYSGLVDYSREQKILQELGYVVVTPDLRNHGDSDDDPAYATDLNVGATLDAINAARALAADPGVDPDRIAIVGHSLGGAITLNVAVVAPEVARATVALAPSNASPWENVTHFFGGTPIYDWVTLLRGTPEDNTEYWDAVSSLTFVDRATSPLLVVQGTADQVIPAEWSRELIDAWTAAGKDATLVEVDGADHVFAPNRDEAFAAVASFLTHVLR